MSNPNTGTVELSFHIDFSIDELHSVWHDRNTLLPRSERASWRDVIEHVTTENWIQAVIATAYDDGCIGADEMIDYILEHCDCAEY